MSGTLYGVGVGPGDPELITLKAHRLISQAKVIAYPAADHGVSFARQIVSDFISENCHEIPMIIPMRSERFPAQTVYDRAAERIAVHLDEGQDVVTICEGDPFFYGSFMYLFARLVERFRTQIVPGVSSLNACTAAAMRPLCARNEVLTVIPSTLPASELKSLLAQGGATAILKVGRHLPVLREVIEKAGLAARAVFVAHASLPYQSVLPLAEAPETAPYFSMVLIAGTDPYAAG